MQIKKRRGLVALVVAFGCVAAVAFFLSGGPVLVYKDAYDRIRIGMGRDEVERLVPLVIQDHPAAEGADIAVAHFEDATSRVCGGAAFDSDPVIRKSRYNTWPPDARQEIEEGDVIVYADAKTRAVLGKERVWVVRGEMLTVVFDPEDRVVEKVHLAYAVKPRPGLLGRLLRWLGVVADERVAV